MTVQYTSKLLYFHIFTENIVMNIVQVLYTSLTSLKM